MVVLPEADTWLPRNVDARYAYRNVNRTHKGLIFNTAEQLLKYSIEQIQPMAGDYLTASVAYIANRAKHPFIRQAGLTAWSIIGSKIVATKYVSNVQVASVRDGVHPLLVLERSFPDEPAIYLFSKVEDIVRTQQGIVYLPPQFFVDARTQPINSLAVTVFLCTQIMDFHNDLIPTTSEASEIARIRARVAEAQFVLDHCPERLRYKLSLSVKTSLAQYPNGFNTSNLPEGLVYEGTNPLPPKDPGLN